MPLADVNPDLGTDFYCLFDLDPNLTIVSGRSTLAQALFRRLITASKTLFGGLIDGVSDEELSYGTDLRARLNAPMESPQSLQRDIERECLKDERVADCRASVTTVEATGQIQVDIAVTDSKGTFPMVITVDKLTGAMLLGKT